MDALKTVMMRLTARWKALGSGQKFVTGSLVAGACLTIGMCVLLAKHVSYATLFTNLEPDQGSSVVEKLRDMKVPYRLTNSGRTIMVPEKEVYGLRLQLASEATPGGSGSGYEIFDRNRFGMTSFMQQMNYRRALEGELTRTIREMDEVLMVRVHLVIPERSLFADDAKQPSASVVLRLKPGVRLGAKQIAGISALVSGSVEGLTADKVNILDCYGNLLSNNQQNSILDAEGAARFEIEGEVARSLEERAQSLLDRVVGPGMAVVRVAAELDFERLERESESYEPNNTAIRSEQQSEASKVEGGDTSTSTTNYEINKTVEHVKRAPGNVKRLTVAVTVDGRYDKPAGGGAPEFTARNAVELDKLAALVRNAVGIDDKRGDQFHIACVQFDHSTVDAEKSEMKSVERGILLQTLLSKGLIVLGAAVAFLILRMIFRSVTRTLNTAPAAMAAGASPDMPGRPAGRDYGVDLDVGGRPARRPDSPANRVTEISRARPQETAALILNMLEQDE